MAVLDFSDQGVAVEEALDFSDQGDPLPDFSNEGTPIDAPTKPERTPEQEAKRAQLLREQKDAQLGGRLSDVGVNATRLAEGATEVVRQTNPLTVLPRLAFEVDKKLGFVPGDQANPMDRPVFSVEEVRKGIDFLTSETVEPGSVKEGAKKFTSEFVSGLTHPDLIAAAAAGGASRIAGKVTQEIVKVLGPAFAGDMIAQAPEAYQDYLQALSGGDKAEITRSALHFTTTVAIPALIAGHARKANRPPPDDLPPLREAELRQQAADTALESTLPLSAKAAGVSGRGTEPVPPGFTTDLGGPIKREPYASEIKSSTEVSRPAAVETPAPSPAPETTEAPRPQERAGEVVQQEAVVRDVASDEAIPKWRQLFDSEDMSGGQASTLRAMEAETVSIEQRKRFQSDNAPATVVTFKNGTQKEVAFNGDLTPAPSWWTSDVESSVNTAANPTPPAAAEAKIRAEVKNVAETQGPRPAKEVKSELVDRLERAIDVAPSEADVTHRAEKVTISIPGDGDFTIFNTKEALQTVLARAKKIKTTSGEPTKISKAAIKSSENVLRGQRDIVKAEAEATKPPQATVSDPIPTAQESQSLGISPTAHPAIRAIANLFNPTGVRNAVGAIKDFFGGYAGRSMPKITRANRELGEQGVRWASSRIAAKPLADVFSTEVIGDSQIDPKKLGTALTEDNLRSVREGFVQAGDATAASRVHTVIGGQGSPFRTEAEYQAFLADPNTQAAIARYKQLWDAQVEPMYKKAMFIDPAEVLPDRGLQTGARVNLMAVQQTNPNTVQGIGKGNLLGTLKKQSPFGVRAKGTGQSYNGNIRDMMQNTFGRQLEIANKNAFDTKLVETGDAVISKPGEQPILKDETTVAFPYVRQRVIIPKEGAPPNVLSQNRSIYVRKSLAKEYSRASNTETKLTGGPVTQFITSMANRSALAGFTDATVHISNLATVLMTRPAVAGKWWQDAALSATGRADLIPIVGRVISKVFQDNAKQLAELAEIGAARQDPPPSSKLNPMNYLADLIHIADRTTRLVMDDAFKRLVDEGVVKNTETNRREWVNQTGQYNKRLQGKWTAAGRDSGLSPFITAGKNFTTLGVKNVTLNPGVKATNLASAAALRANVAAKWVGLGVLAGTLNYLLTKDKPGGGMMGRPGTPVGDVDSGMNDENGRPLVFPLASVIGLGRGLRVTGIRGYTEAKRKGLPSKVAMDAAIRDMVNSQASLMAGPPVRLAVAGASGYAPAINVGRASPVVPPGESQHLSDIKGALIEANPVLASIHAAHAPGGTIGAGIQKQFPRFTLAPKQPPEMLEKYPEIVRKAQANDYINDVIRRARKMKPEAKMKFLNESVKKLAPEDQRHAWEMFKRRRLLQ